MAKIPKECYTLFDELVEKRKKNQLSFEDMYNTLTEQSHWAVVDWKKMRQRKREEITLLQVLIVCKKNLLIEKKPIHFNVHVAKKAISEEKLILIPTSLAHRWKYAIIENRKNYVKNNLENLIIVTGATCGADGTTAGGTARQVAVLYAAETTGDPQPRCVSS